MAEYVSHGRTTEIPGHFQQVVNDVLKQHGFGFQSSYELIEAFTYAINWRQDRWLWGILGVHLLLLTTAILSRKFWKMQMTLLALLCR